MQAQFSLDTSSCKWSIPEVRCSATASSSTAGHDMCPARGMLSGKGGQEGEIPSGELLSSSGKKPSTKILMGFIACNSTSVFGTHNHITYTTSSP